MEVRSRPETPHVKGKRGKGRCGKAPLAASVLVEAKKISWGEMSQFRPSILDDLGEPKKVPSEPKSGLQRAKV